MGVSRLTSGRGHAYVTWFRSVTATPLLSRLHCVLLAELAVATQPPIPTFGGRVAAGGTSRLRGRDEQRIETTLTSEVTTTVRAMDETSWKDVLEHYLRRAHRSVHRTIDGVSEYDLRRPLTPTGTNLLGVVKHLATVEHGYLVTLPGRTSPAAEVITWDDEESMTDNADLWVERDMSSESVISLYDQVEVASLASMRELPLDTPVTVPWWRPDARDTTLGLLAVHVIAETAQHAGQLDILREQLDGATAESSGDGRDTTWWRAYVDKISAEAEHFA